MKKSELWIGWISLAAGIVLIGTALLGLVPQGIRSIILGLGGGFTGVGLGGLFRHSYWNRPENYHRYQQKMKREEIDLKDELKVSMRDKAGRMAHQAGLMVSCGGMLVFSILDGLEILDGGILTLYLWCYVIFQLILDSVFYKWLMKRY